MHWSDYETTYNFLQKYHTYSIMPGFSKEMCFLDNWSCMRVGVAKKALSVRAAQTIGMCYIDSKRIAAANLACGLADSSDQGLMMSSPAGTCDFIEQMAYIVRTLDPDCSRQWYGMNNSEDKRITDCIAWMANTRDVHTRYAEQQVADRGLDGAERSTFIKSCGLSRETMNALECVFQGLRGLLKQYHLHYPRENMEALPPKMRVPTQQCLEGLFSILRYSGKTCSDITERAALAGIKRLQVLAYNHSVMSESHGQHRGHTAVHGTGGDGTAAIKIPTGVCPTKDGVLAKLWQIRFLNSGEVAALEPLVKMYRVEQASFVARLYKDRMHPAVGKTTVTWGGSAWSQRRKVSMLAVMQAYFLDTTNLLKWKACLGAGGLPASVTEQKIAVMLTLLASQALSLLHESFAVEFRAIRDSGGSVKVATAEEVEAAEGDDGGDSSDDDDSEAVAAVGEHPSGPPKVVVPRLVGEELAFNYTAGWTVYAATASCAKKNNEDACFVLDHFNSSFGAVMSAVAAPGERLYRVTDAYMAFMRVVEKCAVDNLGLLKFQSDLKQYYNKFYAAIFRSDAIDAAWATLITSLGSPSTLRVTRGNPVAKLAILEKFFKMRSVADQRSLGLQLTNKAGTMAFRNVLKAQAAKKTDPQTRALLTGDSATAYYITFPMRVDKIGVTFAAEASDRPGHNGRMVVCQIQSKLFRETGAYTEGSYSLAAGDVVLEVNGRRVNCDDGDYATLLEANGHFPVTMKLSRMSRVKTFSSGMLTALEVAPWTIHTPKSKAGGRSGDGELVGSRENKRTRQREPVTGMEAVLGVS